ncbi:MAG: 1-acyl-sn-glycerol-3-phosphate acyltransferase [Bacteroidia bacterium]|nr:1-acyl-sn-glycerol-3-phosphate acyltransferase [Bacteroidia bacterium]
MYRVKLHPNPFVTIYTAWFSLLIVVQFILLYPLIYFFLSFKSFYPFAHAVRKFIFKTSFLFSGMRLKTELPEGFDPKQTYIIVANHGSKLDIATLVLGIPQCFSFLAMKVFLKIPLYGIWFRTLDLAVNKKDVRDSAQAYLKVKELLNSGRSVVIFPEGTVSPKVPELASFKEGAFRLSLETGIPVLPVIIINNYKLAPDKHVFEMYPGISDQIVLNPIWPNFDSGRDFAIFVRQLFVSHLTEK